MSNFDRFSLTITRWLFTSQQRRSPAGNYTTPRDVTQDAIAGRLELSLPELRAVTQLMRTGTASVGELADAAGLTSGAATRMVDRLEVSGWVVRHPDEQDRRKVRVVLRKVRRGELGEIYASMSASWIDALADRSDAELATVLELFDRMRAVARSHTADLGA